MSRRKCRECGTWFKAEKGDGVLVCSIPCSILFGPKEKERQLKREAAQRKQEANYNSGPWLKKQIQARVNLIARLIDQNLACLATGNFGKMNGGHVYSRGAHTQMKFNLHNIHRQSYHSNHKQTHDGLMQEKLELEYGREYLEYLRKLRGAPVVKKTVAELQEVYENTKAAEKELKRVLEPYEGQVLPKEIRIELRNAINDFISYYGPEGQFITSGEKGTPGIHNKQSIAFKKLE